MTNNSDRASCMHNGQRVYGTVLDAYTAEGDSVAAVLWDGAVSACPVDVRLLEPA